MPSDRRPLPASLYADTARPAPAEATLSGEISTSVAIVGGGFTGLSTALHLAEAGVAAVVLEASEPGWGASGRNGGQVNPGLKWNPEELVAHFGEDLGGRMARMGASAPDLVFDLVARHAIACEATRGGTVRAAIATARSQADVAEYARQWRTLGAPVDLLDRAGVERVVGTSAYASAAYDRRGGSVNPLGYARGLADAALKAGAKIFCDARALKLERSGSGWVVTTAGGRVRADRVVIATNGYTDGLLPGLRRTVIPAYSAIVATEPLAPAVAARIMPTRPVLYEMSAAYAYYRVDAFGRFVMGGRSVLRDSSAFADYRGLVAHAERLFPDLKGARWTHCWNGQTAITWDHLPHVHEPEEGLHVALGYNGRGVAMASAMGVRLAKRAAGAPVEALDLPVTGIAPIFAHAAWPLAVTARLKWDMIREVAGF